MFQDVAMAFENNDGSRQLWFGRLQKLLVRSASGSRKVLLDAVPIDNLPMGLQVRAQYYTPVPRKQRTFKYGVGSKQVPEAKSYDAACILHIVEFEYDIDRDEYKLDSEVWRIVQEKLSSL